MKMTLLLATSNTCCSAFIHGEEQLQRSQVLLISAFPPSWHRLQSESEKRARESVEALQEDMQLHKKEKKRWLLRFGTT